MEKKLKKKIEKRLQREYEGLPLCGRCKRRVPEPREVESTVQVHGVGPSLNVNGFKNSPSPVPLLIFYHTCALPVNVGSGTVRLHLPHSGWPLYSFRTFFSIFFLLFPLYLTSCFRVVYNACTSGFISVCASEQLMKALEPKRPVLSILLCQCSIKWFSEIKSLVN